MEIQNSIFKLDDWSIVEISGSDATNFLQNQLTNSVTNIPISPKGEMAKLQVANKFAAYCSAKGRIIATFWISQPNENCYHLLLSSDIAESLTKKLKMYVLRSKVTIEVQSLLQLYGVTHTTKLDLADQDNYFQYELPSITFDGQIINRKIFATPRDVNISCNSDPVIWNWLEVISAIPRITEATLEQFVPQMINMESLQGIDLGEEKKEGKTFEEIRLKALGINASADDVVSLQGPIVQEAGFGIGAGLGYSKQ